MPRTKVVVTLPETSYDVRIGTGLLGQLGEHLRAVNQATNAVVIADENTSALYGDAAKASLNAAGYFVTELKVPAGESSKSISCISEIWEALAASGLSRDTLVIALGGGVVGDLAGFVGATYMRGVDVVQVPTSLLAMVDSSVGGKTGINLQAGKNLVGAFKQPNYVCASTDTLNTLPDREWVCGCAEIAKSAVIESDEFFFWLNEHAQDLAQRDEAVVIEAITRSVVFKANVVASDTFESKGVRECLNYGHTLGHAIEKLAGYGTFSHGQAVAEGMRFAARLGVELLGTSTDVVAAQDELLDSLGLESLDWSRDPQTMIDVMLRDKKVRKGALRFVLPRDIGSWEVLDVQESIIREHLEAWERSKQ